MENRRDKFVMQKGGIEVIKQGVPYVLKKDRKKQESDLIDDDKDMVIKSKIVFNDDIDDEKSEIVNVKGNVFIDDREFETKFELYNGNEASISNDKKKSKKE